MKLSVRLLAAVALLAASACTTKRAAGPQTLPDATPGAIGEAPRGYLIDDIAGGRRARIAMVRRAGIGGTPSAAIGGYMDRQEREMRARTAGTDVRVTRQGDDLLLIIPASFNFATASAALQPQFRTTLDAVAGVLTAYPASWIDVYGHTDSNGTHARNQALSEARARSVSDYLAGHGVQQARLGIRGYGETQPVAPNDSEDGRAANRRVEIKVVPIPESDLR